jgi:hypothetical protein
MDTILLDTVSWDFVLDVHGNIAVASDPYSLAQDAASAIRTFLGECYFDTTIGVNYSLIIGTLPTLSVMKAQFVAAAKTVPGVTAARVVIASVSDRTVTGQVQITDISGNTAVSNF